MKDLGEGETPLSDGGLSLPKPLLLSPNFAEPNLIHSAYQVARLRGVARGGFLYAGMRFGSAKFFVFLEGILGVCAASHSFCRWGAFGITPYASAEIPQGSGMRPFSR